MSVNALMVIQTHIPNKRICPKCDKFPWHAIFFSQVVKKFIVLFAFLIFSFSSTQAFSLLSHEAVIDASWEKSIRPLLKKKYPSATNEDLKNAHAYLYGGSIVPDIGYYPFGSMLFTNLLHYVRTGDFIYNALSEAKDVNEYAFALGLLCHYNADKYGHELGTNVALPILFPDERKKHGDTITYEEDKTKHIKVEFGFDVIQTVKGNYAPKAQHDFIGFKISEPLLERAFLKTYGFEISDVFKSLPVAIETFRFTVKQLIPELTKDAWKARNGMITKINPLAEKSSYTKKYDRKEYKKEFGRPQLKSSVLSFILGLIPKVGPFAGLKFKEPNEEVEKIFDKSLNAILSNYTAMLDKLGNENIKPENINFDTGKKTRRNEYLLADKCYYELLRKHEKKEFRQLTPAMKKNFLEYYSAKSSATNSKEYKAKKTAKAIAALKQSDVTKNDLVKNEK